MDNDNKKKEKPDLAVLGMKFRFTSENQPKLTTEQKRKNTKEGWTFRNTRRKFIEELSIVTLKGGEKRNFWEEAIKQIHAELLADKKIAPSKKIELFLKLQELTPREDTLNVNPDIDGFEISFSEPEVKESENNSKKEENLNSDIESHVVPDGGDKK